MDKILDDPKMVKGLIYVVEHTSSGMKYVGQTVSHRLNHGRYRPFGAQSRFKHHISEALCNTKHKTGHKLGIDIRKYGADAFTVAVLQECELDERDNLEKYYITTLHTLHPEGYNLTIGGQGAKSIAIIENDTPLNPPGKRGGCILRTEETREKISKRLNDRGYSEEERAARTEAARLQHLVLKSVRFDGLIVDHTIVDSYIHKRKGRIIVDVNGVTAHFDGKNESEEALRERAREFLLSLTPATLPNCSGNP
jgi:hypothetical protein